MFKIVLVIFGNIGVLMEEREKSSDIVQKSSERFRRGFQSSGELNNE
jgi:hypothetical protein